MAFRDIPSLQPARQLTLGVRCTIIRGKGNGRWTMHA
jgi:hypothetical protein